jgi:hypothetical protein
LSEEYARTEPIADGISNQVRNNITATLQLPMDYYGMAIDSLVVSAYAFPYDKITDEKELAAFKARTKEIIVNAINVRDYVLSTGNRATEGAILNYDEYPKSSNPAFQMKQNFLSILQTAVTNAEDAFRKNPTCAAKNVPSSEIYVSFFKVHYSIPEYAIARAKNAVVPKAAAYKTAVSRAVDLLNSENNAIRACHTNTMECVRAYVSLKEFGVSFKY